jgi:hypothetical protein
MEVEGRRGEGDHFATFKITLEWNGIRREQSIACTEREEEVEVEQSIACTERGSKTCTDTAGERRERKGVINFPPPHHSRAQAGVI